MPALSPYAERTVVAFLDGPDNLGITNIIHSTEGAAAYGFQAALVGGVTVYGWTVPSILLVLGNDWLDDGWIDVRFRQPVYPDDVMTARVTTLTEDATVTMTNQDGVVCLEGTVGRGEAPWLVDLTRPVRLAPVRRLKVLPQLTPESIPVGRDLRPMAVRIPRTEAKRYALETQMDANRRWGGRHPRIHPGWIAGRMTRLMHHSFDYGPSIHTRSQIQNLAPAFAGQSVTVAGRVVDAFERREQHYAVVDGLILAEDGCELVRLRHTTIYRLQPSERA